RAGLSDVEVEVLRLVACGLPNKEIAHSLSITPKTVEHHVQHIYGKLGVATRAGATLFAAQHDLVYAAPAKPSKTSGGAERARPGGPRPAGRGQRNAESAER